MRRRGVEGKILSSYSLLWSLFQTFPRIQQANADDYASQNREE